MNTQQPTKYNVLLIGDNCIDEYRFGVVERLSPEAPVPIFLFKNSYTRPGMAANVACNLNALGCNVRSYFGPVSYKVRLIDTKTQQHLLRIDTDCVVEHPLTFNELDFNAIDAVAISDYEKGYISRNLILDIISKFKGPVFLDTKKNDLASYSCFIKVNDVEYANRTSDSKNVIVTKGGAGALWNGKLFPTTPVSVSDVCGAGDTFFSALIYSYLTTKGNMSQSIDFANKASSITVQHIGTYAPTLEEINAT